MAAIESQLGKFAVSIRLFELIDKMPVEKQFILLKQLLRNDIPRHIYKTILDMTSGQKLDLLEKLGEIPQEETTITTIQLDEIEPAMRSNPRKSCLIKAKYKIDNRLFENYIIDISNDGGFIETADTFKVPTPIIINFELPGCADMLKLQGNVIRSDSLGIGIKFKHLTQSQAGMIRKYSESI